MATLWGSGKTTPDVTGEAIASVHYMAEEAPYELTAELRHFLLQHVPP